ncbi:MAG: hypothetical protein EOM23_10225 [Candidatus Moranbacteria bacterium]|nr:hypothetical protein [Candidatus Moranbacteria bacterium]
MLKKEVSIRIIKAVFVLMFSTLITACASVSVIDYPNITINEEKKIETIRFVHPKSASTDSIKTCIIANVENKDIPIRHSVGMWAMWTAFVLLPDKQDSIEGGDVILSDKDGVVQATGNVELEPTINKRNFLIFLLTAQNIPNEGTELIFSKPSIVLEDTGAGRNPGAVPLGSHSIALFERNYNALELISNRIGSCLAEP